VSWIDGLATRARLLFGKRAAESRFDSEMRFHVDMEAQRLEREAGLAPDEARRRALAAFGGVENHREALRDGRGTAWMAGLSLDVKLALRMLVKYPALTVVGVLGISVAVTIGALAFSAVNALTASTMPFDEGDRVIGIRNFDALTGQDIRATHLHDLETWRESAKTVTELGAYRITTTNLLVDDFVPISVRAAEMTASGFRLSRTAPLQGRYLRDDDELPGAPDVAVIGFDLWQRELEGRDGIVGSSIQLGKSRYLVVGIMPSGYAFPVNNQVWTPLRLKAIDHPRNAAPSIDVFARLAPTASVSSAQREFTAIAQRLTSDEPVDRKNIRTRVTKYAIAFLDNPGMAWMLHLIQVAVSLLLVVIGTNVAVLVYARTASRTSEIAVRTALGASRRRIVTQLFAEAVALSGLASAVGLVAARFVFARVQELAISASDGQIPYWIRLEVTPSAVFYVVGLALLAAIIIGVIPGLKATRMEMTSGIRGAGGNTLQLGRGWTGLLVFQVAISVAALPLSLEGGEMWVTMSLRDYGTAATESFVIASPKLAIDDDAWRDTARVRVHRERYASLMTVLERELLGLPGGAQVVKMSAVPMEEESLRIEAERPPNDPTLKDAVSRAPEQINTPVVDKEFFKTFGVRLLAGRLLEDADYAEGATQVVVNQSFIKFHFGEANGLGRRVRQNRERGTPGPWWEIVGVVEDYPKPIQRDDISARLYLPLRVKETYPLAFAVRAPAVPMGSIGDEIRKATIRVDPDLSYAQIRTVESVMTEAADRERWAMSALVMICISVALLAAAGIYALMSFTVTRRRREIGIRSALGASRTRVVLEILSRGFRQISIGIVIGAILLGAFLWLVTDSYDIPKLAGTLSQIAGMMLVFGLLATFGPARRALKVQPTEVLKAE
jgi:putative ABC transport system permease protein